MTVFAAIATLPTVLIVAIFTVFFSTVTFTTRYLVRRRSSPERQEELVTLAEGHEQADGCSDGIPHRFLGHHHVGTISTAQSAVEEVAASAQEVAWLTENLSDRGRPTRSSRRSSSIWRPSPRRIRPDWPLLTSRTCRVSRTWTNSREQVRDIAAGASVGDPEASRALTAASTVAQKQADLVSIARRQLPTSMLWLLLIAGTLSSMVMGIVATKVEHPFLLVGWALVSAIGISVVLSLYNPFAGDVAVDLQPLDDAAQRIVEP